jgi:hypothetical protein
MNRKPKRILLIVVLLVALLGLAGGVYFGTYSRATPEAAALLQGSDTVEVKAMVKGWLLDGPGTEAALVFYPGGKVEATAYLPLLTALAEDGVDCFLVRMPLNMAFMDLNAAGAVQTDYAYDRWYVGGHSLGGAMAALYAADRELDGVILLAAYPTRALDEPMLLLYGSEDGVADRERIAEAERYGTVETLEIEGGNHAFFGDYGLQKRDGEAALSPREQQKETVEAILAWLP